jgi:hypothetical protein
MSLPRRNIESCDQLRATFWGIALLARIAPFLGGPRSGYALGGRLEVRVAPADVEGAFRMLVVRATLVINPNAEAERSRAENLAKPFMTRSCGGQPTRCLKTF